MNEKFWPIWSPVVFQLFLNIMLSKGVFFLIWQNDKKKEQKTQSESVIAVHA